MRYEIGDRVRVRGDLKIDAAYGDFGFSEHMEQYKCRVFTIRKVFRDFYYLEGARDTDGYNFAFTDEMLRPAKFKILCNSEAEEQAVLVEFEKERYMWGNGSKPTGYLSSVLPSNDFPVIVFADDGTLSWSADSEALFENYKIGFTPSEFTGIDFPDWEDAESEREPVSVSQEFLTSPMSERLYDLYVEFAERAKKRFSNPELDTFDLYQDVECLYMLMQMHKEALRSPQIARRERRA